MSTFLIPSRFFETKNSEILKQIKNSLTIPSKSIKDFFDVDNFSQTGKFSCNSVVIKPCSTVFSPVDGFVMLWLVNDTDNFAEFLEMAQNEFENCLCLREDDFITPGLEQVSENSQLVKKSYFYAFIIKFFSFLQIFSFLKITDKLKIFLINFSNDKINIVNLVRINC
jgi:hypothetical protein